MCTNGWGARVQRSVSSITVVGPAGLHGVDVDMADISDTAQTLAAVAVFADTPTRVRGIGFIRGKETDRISAVVAELNGAGVQPSSTMTVSPSIPASRVPHVSRPTTTTVWP